jgi:hypothetical protein
MFLAPQDKFVVICNYAVTKILQDQAVILH